MGSARRRSLANEIRSGRRTGDRDVFTSRSGKLLMGVLFSLLLGVAAINFNADQTLVGTALNLMGTAAAVVIVRAINVAENPDNVSPRSYTESKTGISG